jgi:hypothetical protein
MACPPAKLYVAALWACALLAAVLFANAQNPELLSAELEAKLKAQDLRRADEVTGGAFDRAARRQRRQRLVTQAPTKAPTKVCVYYPGNETCECAGLPESALISPPSLWCPGYSPAHL